MKSSNNTKITKIKIVTFRNEDQRAAANVKKEETKRNITLIRSLQFGFLIIC